MQGEVRQFFVVVFVQRTGRMNLSVPRLHRVPRELDESGLALGRAHTPVFGDSGPCGPSILSPQAAWRSIPLACFSSIFTTSVCPKLSAKFIAVHPPFPGKSQAAPLRTRTLTTL